MTNKNRENTSSTRRAPATVSRKRILVIHLGSVIFGPYPVSLSKVQRAAVTAHSPVFWYSCRPIAQQSHGKVAEPPGSGTAMLVCKSLPGDERSQQPQSSEHGTTWHFVLTSPGFLCFGATLSIYSFVYDGELSIYFVLRCSESWPGVGTVESWFGVGSTWPWSNVSDLFVSLCLFSSRLAVGWFFSPRLALVSSSADLADS